MNVQAHYNYYYGVIVNVQAHYNYYYGAIMNIMVQTTDKRQSQKINLNDVTM